MIYHKGVFCYANKTTGYDMHPKNLSNFWGAYHLVGDIYLINKNKFLFFIKTSPFCLKPIEIFSKRMYNKSAKQNRIK